MKVVLSLVLFAICGGWPAASSLNAQVITGIGDWVMLGVDPQRDRLAREYHLDVEKPSHEDCAKLAHDFPTLVAGEQYQVLDYFWPKVRCAEFVAVLAPLAQLPKEPEKGAETLCDQAFIRLNDLSPGTVRPVILEDLRRAKPLLSMSVLLALPDKELPELDDALLGNLTNPEADIWKVAPLIERYAGARIMPQVVAFYTAKQGWACSLQTAFLRYWLKHDRPAALQAIEKAANSRKATGCYKSVLGDTLRDSFAPDAEELALKFADDPDPDVAADAKRLLEQHPSTSRDAR